MNEPSTMTEEQEEKLAALRLALIEGEKSGLAVDFDPDELLARLHAERGSRP